MEKINGSCKRNGKFCTAMDSIMVPVDERGFSPLMLFNFKTHTENLRGVLYKQTQSDRGTLLNFCPFCSVDYRPWLKPSLTKTSKTISKGNALTFVNRKRKRA